MKRQQITIGAVLEIYVDNKYFVYAQIHDGGYVFFDFKSDKKIKDLNILVNTPILFIVAIFRDVVTKGLWLKIGKLPIRPELEKLPLKFIQDAIKPEKFELYNPNNGEITITTFDKIKGLERTAVWEAHAIEDRIRDYYNGVPCAWLKDDYELFDQNKLEKK
jgi:Immunity protein 26